LAINQRIQFLQLFARFANINKMGTCCCSCCKDSAGPELITPDAETKRRQMAEAAQRRIDEQENRGIKNPESVRRNQMKAAEREKLETEISGSGNANLRWNQD